MYLAQHKPQADSSDSPSGYAELHCLSNFSFQRGASSAAELFDRARDLGYTALAITDECSLAGIVRAWEASKRTGLPLIVGSEMQLVDGPKLVVLATNKDGYHDLCRLITVARRRSAKGEYRVSRSDVEALGDGVLVLWVPGRVVAEPPDAGSDVIARWLGQLFHGRLWIAVELHHTPLDAARLGDLRALGERHALPLVASGDVHMHARGRRALQDALTAIRTGRTVAEAGHALFPNGERHLRPIAQIRATYPHDLVAETLVIAARCHLLLDDLGYEYPHELVPTDLTAGEHLRRLTEVGAGHRWPRGVPDNVRTQIEHELALIAELRYEHFFLTVEDIVAWARAQTPPILCQGRGSSANSAVCYCLGITAVDPASSNLLFERFISRERAEPPDIDVDFEHERREEVIQYVFAKYGRERAAIAATVIGYRGRSAVRDIGRVLGLPEDQLDQLVRVFSRIGTGQELDEWLRERGFDPHSRVLHQLFVLVGELRGFPRHLSQHVGGFVISEKPLDHLVPVENAAMVDRTIIQWDKDDLESLGLLKVDCLALGMLTCLRKCFDLLREFETVDLDLASVPRDDAATWDMICAADTVGVFQIESRAQMAMLPRLRPRCFYDLVIQVAIVRPGPIQGNMVHPYLRRRNGQEPIDYPRSEREVADGRESRIKEVLGRTLGVPIFQEQVMKLVEVVADFTPGEADELRRAMAAWKRRGGLGPFREKIQAGMRRNGYSDAYFEQLFEQITGFGDYGFPESHSASFALLAWASSYLKCHHPAAFACALLNSQPMGFYQPAQIVQDVRRHGVRVLPVDVTSSNYDCTLERRPADNDAEAQTVGTPTTPASLSLRLGLRQVRGLSKARAERIVAARRATPFHDLADLARRADVNSSDRRRLADAGALQSLSGHRHRAHWDSAGEHQQRELLAGGHSDEQRVALRAPSLYEDVMTDYAMLGLSLKQHPLALVRAELQKRNMLTTRAAAVPANRDRRVSCAGVVIVRQHPGTAKGVTFVTMEDETGPINVIVWRNVAERQHRVLNEAKIMGVEGKLQVSEGATHLVAERLHDFSDLLPGLGFASRDFH